MRSHYCGLVDEKLLKKTVTLSGWVQRRRDHGGVIFIDLRDREGLVQIVCHPDNEEVFKQAENIRNEYVLQIKGEVNRRPKGTANANLQSGKIEVTVNELKILNTCAPLPFQLEEHENTGEETRLRYRYLDLRRLDMHNRFRLRADISYQLRQYLQKHGFLDIETPMLTRATPEGARDYLVPSRTHNGAFFALPQSPQLFKQLLMMSGMDRYYQIVRCFRDEDLRADRQPEFTQLDMEMSFVEEKDIIKLVEGMVKKLFKTILDVELPNVFERISYEEAMQRYGSDKPDLRIPLELVEISDILKDVEFKVFAAPANDENGRVAVLKVPGGTELTRKQIDDYTKYVSIYGAKGLAYIKVNDLKQGHEGLQSPILKFLTTEAIAAILKRTKAKTGDILFFGADKKRIVNEALGALRTKVGHDLNLVKKGWRLLWVVDFPMFEWDEDKQRWEALHHPFTAPQNPDPRALFNDPGAAISRAYDLVVNGTELGGGSIRIDNLDMQLTVLELLGLDEEQAKQRFGFFINALQYGCPPHGGIAFGLDRLAMLITGGHSLRDVIAFPKTQSASCPLTEAPAQVDNEQLKELGIKIAPIKSKEIT